MLDRKLAPKFKLSPSFDFLKAQKRKIADGLEAHYIDSPNQELLKIDFVFSAGIQYTNQLGLAKAVSSLLMEGTEAKSSREISESIEGQGAFVSSSCSLDHAGLTLYVIQSRLKAVLTEVLQLFQYANFPNHEIENYRIRQIQKLKVNQQKVSFLAKKGFKNMLFPQGHPYHNGVKLEDYETLDRKDLLRFYSEHYQNKLPRIYLSGNLNPQVWKDLEYAFKKVKLKAAPEYIPSDFSIGIAENKIRNIEKADAVQTALTIGKYSINRNHEDYQKLLVLNTLLGGYFGSRLMSNIREDKGYTYGIGSGVFSFKHAAYFYIQTEVGQAVSQNTVDEISKEIKRLQQEKVSLNELQLVKNYMIGSLMRNFDGAYEAMDRFKGLNEFGMDYNFYQKLFKTIENINPDELVEMANKHLKLEEMYFVSAGKNKIEATI